MKEKLESVEDDRHWLEGQLKASKKQNKLLCAELDIRLAGPEEGYNGGDLRNTRESVRPVGRPDSGRLTGGNELQRAPPRRVQSAKGNRGEKNIKKDLSASQSESRLGNMARIRSKPKRGLSGAQNQDHNSEGKKGSLLEITSLRRELRSMRLELARLRAKEVERQSHRVELEELFLQCIEEVKRNVSRRKQRGR